MIESARLFLRKFEYNDYKNLYDLDSKPIVHKYLYNSPTDSHIASKDYIQKQINQYYKYGVGRLVVSDKNNKFIGWAGLKFNTSVINNKKDFYDIGYRLEPDQWGKGIATEASIAILNYYKDFKSISNNIYAMASIDNIASNKVLIKSGLTFVNQFIDPINGQYDNWYEFK